VRNTEFLRFAAHWGFVARACRPYRAQDQGQSGASDPLSARQFPLRP
jgi:transposase